MEFRRLCGFGARTCLVAVSLAPAAACKDFAAPVVSGVSFRLSVTTLGSGSDPDGYILKLDNAHKRRIPASGTVVYNDLSRTLHRFSLEDVSLNCTAGPNPLVVDLGQQDPPAAGIVQVGCTAAPSPPTSLP